jgi:hypothetical protein
LLLLFVVVVQLMGKALLIDGYRLFVLGRHCLLSFEVVDLWIWGS